jgi:hypothetical protein
VQPGRTAKITRRGDPAGTEPCERSRTVEQRHLAVSLAVIETAVAASRLLPTAAAQLHAIKRNPAIQDAEFPFSSAYRN